jgi:hypothetical protein
VVTQDRLAFLLARRPDGIFVAPFEQGSSGVPDWIRGLGVEAAGSAVSGGQVKTLGKMKNCKHPAMTRVGVASKQIVPSCLLSRPLRSRSDRRHGGECLPESEYDQAQKGPQPGENAAKIVTDGGEDDVCGVTLLAFEMAAAEVAIDLHVSDDGFDCRATSQFALDDAEDATLLTGDENAPRIGRVVAAIPALCYHWNKSSKKLAGPLKPSGKAAMRLGLSFKPCSTTPCSRTLRQKNGDVPRPGVRPSLAFRWTLRSASGGRFGAWTRSQLGALPKPPAGRCVGAGPAARVGIRSAAVRLSTAAHPAPA